MNGGLEALAVMPLS